MSQTPIYGLDRELAKKNAGKYDPSREREVRDWMSKILDEPLNESTKFHELLKSGIILVRLIIKLVPDTKIKPNASSMPFKQMENINNFLLALDRMGVPKHDQFQTIDLFEAKNMGQVVDTIYAFSRNAHKKGFTNILLGPKLSDRHEIEFTQEIINRGKSITPQQMGTNTGANASGINYGARREVTPSNK